MVEVLRKIIFTLHIICFALLLSACHYEFGRNALSSDYHSICVPYAQGDTKGGLTNELIKKIASSGAFSYVSCDGDLILKVKFIELDDENIGFRYDRDNKGKLKRSIIPTETRIFATVEVSLIDSKTGILLRGPTRIKAVAEFDHCFYTSRCKENEFSLGQLNDIDAARDAVMTPLNRNLAEKIVDYVNHSW